MGYRSMGTSKEEEFELLLKADLLAVGAGAVATSGVKEKTPGIF